MRGFERFCCLVVDRLHITLVCRRSLSDYIQLVKLLVEC
jgi:hypothetical protein